MVESGKGIMIDDEFGKRIKIDNEYYCDCSLLNRIMNIGLCYDIQMIRCKAIKPEIVREEIDYGRVGEFCDVCSFNQLTG